MPDDSRSSQLNSLRIDRGADSHLRAAPRRWPLLLGGALVLVLVAIGIVRFTGRSAPPPSPTPATDTSLVTPTPADPGSLVASGYVVARRRATVAAEITGRVAEVLVEEGMVVTPGQLLARLDDTLASTDLATATAHAEAAAAVVPSTRAQLTDAERILRRDQALVAEHLVSDAELTRADTQVADLHAQLARAEADLATARSDAKHARELLTKHRIIAPFAGVVVDKNAQPGEIISPISAGGGFTRTGICTIVDMDSLEIEVDVNEAYIARVKPDQAVKATLDAYPDWTIPARVIAIVPTANREKATVRVRIALLEKDPRILPDMAVKVSMSPSASPSAS
jgi:RND family efflux transporter MFP subunit